MIKSHVQYSLYECYESVFYLRYQIHDMCEEPEGGQVRIWRDYSARLLGETYCDGGYEKCGQLSHSGVP